MERLLEQGGLASIAVQWSNSLLMLLLFALFRGQVDARSAYRSIFAARVWMTAAVSVVLVWFYLLPSTYPGFSAGAHPLTGVALGLYVGAKCAFWWSLASGCRVLLEGRGEPPRPDGNERTPWILGALLLASLATMVAWPRLNVAFMIQSVTAIGLLLPVVFRSPVRPGDLSVRLIRMLLGTQVLVWTFYGLAFLGVETGTYRLVAEPFAAFWLANAYVDSLLDALLTFSVLFALVADRYQRAQLSTRERLERVRAQQAAVVELARNQGIRKGEYERFARTAARAAARALGVSRVSIWRYSPETSELVPDAIYSATDDSIASGDNFDLSQAPVYFASLVRSRFIAAGNAAEDERTAEFAENYLQETGVGALVDVAIGTPPEIQGVLCLEHQGGAREWHDDEVAFAGFVADQLSQTLANQRAMQAEARRKNLEEQLRQAQKMEAVGQLAGGVAHDFNNILCAVLGYSSLIKTEVPEDLRDYVAQIESAAQRAAELTHKMLSFSRRQVLRKEVVQINEVVEEVVDFLRRVTEESIEVELSLSQGAGRALLDRTEFQQVLLNISNNARDAMPDGGKLRIETLGEVTAIGPTVTILISDTGEGIPPDRLQRIFEPFYTTKPEGKGTGLGLATSYGILEQHGGRIEVTSEVGIGTCFELNLPAVRVPASWTQFTMNPGGAGDPCTVGGQETLLVIEEGDDLRAQMEETLGNAGYQVLSASDGETGLELYLRFRTELDAVLLDWILPKLSGADLLPHLHAGGTPTIGISGTGHASDAGFDVLLPKPFAPRDLLAAVRAALGAQQGAPRG